MKHKERKEVPEDFLLYHLKKRTWDSWYIIHDKKIFPLHVMMYTCISRSCWHAGFCMASDEELSEQMGQSVDVVKTLIKNLQECFYLIRSNHFTMMGKNVNIILNKDPQFFQEIKEEEELMDKIWKEETVTT
jgi:hypothetical protein